MEETPTAAFTSEENNKTAHLPGIYSGLYGNLHTDARHRSDLIFGMKDTLDHTFTIWPAHAPSSLTFNQGFTQIIYCSEGCVLHIYRNRRHLLCIQTRGNIISVTTTRANASLFNICILKRRLAKIRGLLWGKRVLHAICLPSLHKTKQLHKVRRHL